MILLVGLENFFAAPRKGKIAGHEMRAENVLRGFENAKIKDLEKMLGGASKETWAFHLHVNNGKDTQVL